MKTEIKSYIAIIILLLMPFITVFAALPTITVSDNGQTYTFHFKGGPGVDGENQTTTCPNNSETFCKDVVVNSRGQIVAGPSGIEDMDSYVKEGERISLFVFTNEQDPNTGVGYINIKLLENYYYMLDSEVNFEQEPGQAIIPNFQVWLNIVNPQ